MAVVATGAVLGFAAQTFESVAMGDLAELCCVRISRIGHRTDARTALAHLDIPAYLRMVDVGFNQCKSGRCPGALGGETWAPAVALVREAISLLNDDLEVLEACIEGPALRHPLLPWTWMGGRRERSVQTAIARIETDFRILKSRVDTFLQLVRTQ